MYDYDILKKSNDGCIFWVECVTHSEQAKLRLKQLAARSPGEYIVFPQASHEVVASTADAGTGIQWLTTETLDQYE